MHISDGYLGPQTYVRAYTVMLSVNLIQAHLHSNGEVICSHPHEHTFPLNHEHKL